MKAYYLILLFFVIHKQGNAQDKLEFSGTEFWAMTVPNVSATSVWYEDVFQLKLLKEIRFDKGHVRIIGNENLVLEILQIQGSKSLADCSLSPTESHLLKGVFKTGFYVNDIAAAERYFKSNGATFKHDLFEDVEMNAKSFILVDLNNNMIQVLQKIK